MLQKERLRKSNLNLERRMALNLFQPCLLHESISQSQTGPSKNTVFYLIRFIVLGKVSLCRQNKIVNHSFHSGTSVQMPWVLVTRNTAQLQNPIQQLVRVEITLCKPQQLFVSWKSLKSPTAHQAAATKIVSLATYSCCDLQE